MAGTSLLLLIDDIATVLDDVALMTKVAVKKSAGVLGDDLALNAQQVSGVKAVRELPVVWAVAKGSLRNKLILVPSALAIGAFAPWAVTPLLMLGGAFLCYEGFEKLAHKFLHSKAEDKSHHHNLVKALANPAVDMVAFEKEKIHGAVRTDFILSAEVIIITMGTIAAVSFVTQVAVLTSIALLMTVVIYGLVGGIVKLDDVGLYLSQARSKLMRGAGIAIVLAAPYMMKGLSIIGTAAMFLVGGGILTHGIPGASELIQHLARSVSLIPGIGGVLQMLAPALLDALAGLLAGALILAGVSVAGRAWRAASKRD